jgi:glutathione S-transferase
MAAKLYGAAHSTCTRRVMAVLEENHATYQLISVNLAKLEHETADFMATKHPYGKISILNDDVFLIYDSRAICKHIAKNWVGQGTKFIPEGKNVRAYGMFEQV